MNKPYNNRVMPKPKTMTEALKRAIRESGDSLFEICKATGFNEDSLSRFMRGEQSLRLDLADKLAAYFGIEWRRTKKSKETK